MTYYADGDEPDRSAEYERARRAALKAATPPLACVGRGLWIPPDRPGPDLLDNSPCGWTGSDARVCPDCGGRVDAAVAGLGQGLVQFPDGEARR
jgi:hypothetical protein